MQVQPRLHLQLLRFWTASFLSEWSREPAPWRGSKQALLLSFYLCFLVPILSWIMCVCRRMRAWIQVPAETRDIRPHGATVIRRFKTPDVDTETWPSHLSYRLFACLFWERFSYSPKGPLIQLVEEDGLELLALLLSVTPHLLLILFKDRQSQTNTNTKRRPRSNRSLYRVSPSKM